MTGFHASWLMGVAVVMGGLAPLAQAQERPPSEVHICQGEDESHLYAMAFQVLGSPRKKVPQQLQSALLMAEQDACTWKMGIVRTHLVQDPYPREWVTYAPKPAYHYNMGTQTMVRFDVWDEAIQESKIDVYLALAPEASHRFHRLGFWREIHLETDKALAWGVIALEDVSARGPEALADLKPPQCTSETVRTKARKPLGTVFTCEPQTGEGAAFLVHHATSKMAFGLWEENAPAETRLAHPVFHVKGYKDENVQLSFRLHTRAQGLQGQESQAGGQVLEVSVQSDGHQVKGVSPLPR